MEKNSLLIIVLLTVLPICYSATPAEEIFTYDKAVLYLVEGANETVAAFSSDVDNLNGNIYFDGTWLAVYYVVQPKYIDAFEALVKKYNLKQTIVSKSYQQYINKEKAKPGTPFSWTAYYGVNDIHKYLHDLSTSDCNVKLLKIGKSFENRPIIGVNINTGGQHNKPQFFIESGIHAREWIAPATTTYFINQLLTSKNPNITAIRDQFDWHIFPLVNPDGYQYSYDKDRFWRKSRSLSKSGCHGVDLNRNWDTENWGVYDASNDSCAYSSYMGSMPFSEPETKAESQYLSKLTNLQAFTTVHSNLQMLLFPLSGSDEHVSNYDDLVKIGKSAISYGYLVNKFQYDGPGTASEISYKSSGESMDWVYNKLKVPVAYTFELRGGLYDWPPSKINQIGDEFTQMILGLVTEGNQLGYFKTTKKTV